MRWRWRWAVVLVATAALACVPAALQLLPTPASPIGARTLLARVQASAGVAWSGYAESDGGLSLPVSAAPFTDLADLLGGQSRLRVWWRANSDWRVDSIGLTGETDVHRDAGGIWTWDYESATARRTGTATRGAPVVRTPRADDLVPAMLARRLLSEADPAAVSRLPTQRVAGHVAAGLRLAVHDSRSTVGHVDVWALPGSGLPVRVSVVGRDGSTIVSSRLLDLSLARPAAGVTAFTPAGAARVEDGEFDDIVSVIDQFGRSTPPATLAGLPRRTDLQLGAVGVYGRGVDVLIAVPLSARLAGDVVPALRRSPGVVENDTGIALGVGPLNVRLSPPAGFGARWLVAGTLTQRALQAAVRALPPAQGFGFGR